MKTFRVVRKWIGVNSDWSLEVTEGQRVVDLVDFSTEAEALVEVSRLVALERLHGDQTQPSIFIPAWS